MPQLSLIGPQLAGTSPFGPGDEETPRGDVQTVEDLLAQLDQPTAPTPPTTSKAAQFFGPIGDAISAAAAVRGGNAPPAIGQFAATQLAEQKEYRIAKAKFEEDRQELNNAILSHKIERLEKAEAATAKAEAELDKERLLRERQRIDDERDAGNAQDAADAAAIRATDKWKREAAFELSKAGVPGMGDPSKLSMQDIINAALGVSTKAAGIELTAEQRIAAQDKAMELIDPNLKRTGVAFTTKDGIPNARYSSDPFKELSVADGKRAENLGIAKFDAEGNPRLPQDVSNDIVARENEDRNRAIAERAARLALAVKRADGSKSTVDKEVREIRAMVRGVIHMEKLLGSTGEEPGGWAAGRIAPGIRYAFLNLTSSADINREVTIGITGIENRLLRIRSGAAVTLSEAERAFPEIPKMTDSKETMFAKLKAIRVWETGVLKDAQAEWGITDDDIDFIDSELHDPAFIPTEAEAGDTTLFGGDQ